MYTCIYRGFVIRNGMSGNINICACVCVCVHVCVCTAEEGGGLGPAGCRSCEQMNCVAVSCIVLKFVALQSVAVCCSVLQIMQRG